jgi:hypothetical protein
MKIRELFILAFVFATGTFFAQRNLKPKMAPEYEKGYYVNQRNDTTWGEVQTNPENDISFYKEFYFRKGAGKPRLQTSQRAKAYGFGGKDFVLLTIEGEKLFCERLVAGRLRLFEYKTPGKVDGYDAIVSKFYIKDTQPQTPGSELADVRRLPEKFYKKALRQYMAEQPMIWSDLDKYNFSTDKLVQALNEFNKYYPRSVSN